MSSENALLPRVWELERSLATAVRVNESLRQQLATREAQIVMLRNAITEGLSTYKVPMTARIVEALAATADLENVRLCEKEPVTTWYGENGEYKFPLYRAREPTK